MRGHFFNIFISFVFPIRDASMAPVLESKAKALAARLGIKYLSDQVCSVAAPMRW